MNSSILTKNNPFNNQPSINSLDTLDHDNNFVRRMFPYFPLSTFNGILLYNFLIQKVENIKEFMK